LGSQDYYTKKRFEPLREKYFDLIVDVAVLLGADRAVAMEDAKAIIDFETQVSQVNTSIWLY
jgi:predicted metalloendopeptidase